MDDLAIVFRSREEVEWALQTVRDWSREYGLESNPKKSGVMRCGLSKSSDAGVTEVGSFPVVSEYKYLGSMLDD